MHISFLCIVKKKIICISLLTFHYIFFYNNNYYVHCTYIHTFNIQFNYFSQSQTIVEHLCGSRSNVMWFSFFFSLPFICTSFVKLEKEASKKNYLLLTIDLTILKHLISCHVIFCKHLKLSCCGYAISFHDFLTKPFFETKKFHNSFFQIINQLQQLTSN